MQLLKIETIAHGCVGMAHTHIQASLVTNPISISQHLGWP
jgi:hypothetical protein